jgi:hypothetical protein
MKWSDVIYKIKNGEEYKFSEGNHQVDKIKKENDNFYVLFYGNVLGYEKLMANPMNKLLMNCEITKV